ncbi:hypothetical protein [Paraburkholderia sp. CI3]|uniref:hypothetical protein n=1 Tax=Paraburkholderia sp. CI3 TaxID=2991060 RepID=UPI003D210C80
MAVIERERILRPATRNPKSAYRVELPNLAPDDSLRLTIRDLHGNLVQIREFSARELDGSKSLYFRAKQDGGTWKISGQLFSDPS